MMGMDQIQKANLKGISVIPEQPDAIRCVAIGAAGSSVLPFVLPSHEMWSGKMISLSLLFQNG